MQKYFQIMKATWEEYMTYRLNFVLWRVRWVLQRLIVYFLWWAILPAGKQLFGYTQSMMLTYILLSNIIGTFILGTTTMEIGGVINQGNLSNFLIRPMSFVRYYIARDTADKLLNAAFAVGELALLFIILRPPLYFQTNFLILFLTFIAIAIGTMLYFSYSLILGFFGFWSADVWAPRFLTFVVMEFFAGGLFPLDILPKPLFIASQFMPFYYFIYFPIKVYLGQMPLSHMLTGLSIGAVWVMGLWYLCTVVWRKGLRMYAAEGK